jgi:DNA (cytosine-5)-methyltransferase 1
VTAYYNEHDPYCAQWLRNLIAAGLIADGVVDERSIEDVVPDELMGYTQCHFFAGVGVWSYALRQAGWPDNRPVWTGSCPCQPFSAAGKGGGFADERHLWPAWFYLISQCRPERVYGEQVASKDGLAWFDLVSADLEGAGYAVGANDICAAGLGAPHIRQRLWFVAITDGPGQRARGEGLATVGHGKAIEPDRSIGRMGNPINARLEGHARNGDGARGRAQPAGSVTETSGAGGMVNTESGRTSPTKQPRQLHGIEQTGAPVRPGPTNGHWRVADWLYCRDDKWRPVEPGTFPLAHGAPARVGRLRAYGNAINAEVAKAFIEASMT